jgi:hypothetical protein
VHGRKEDRRRTLVELVAPDDIARVLVVGAILNHELHLVMRRELIEIRPVHRVRFAAGRTLHVHNRDDGIGHRVDGHVAAGLEEHLVAAIEQALHQRVHLVLQQGLAAGDFDQPAVVARHFVEDLLESHLPAAGERIRRIAPAATQVARRQPDEHTRPPDMRRLALHGQIDLVDHH